MSAAIRAQHASVCCECRGPIHRNELIVYAPDDQGFCHVDCEPDFSPWEEIHSHGALPSPIEAVLKGWKEWKALCFEHDKLYDTGMDQTEGRLLAEMMGVEIIEADGDTYSTQRITDLGYGFLIGMAVQRYMERGDA